MATSNAGFEEEILIESTDHRKIANDPPVDSPHHAPYHATFNIRCGCAKCAKMSKPNLGHGTAFLLYDLNRLSGEYYYLATAAHNLYCYNCGDYRWVQIIEKWQETSEGPSPVFLSKRITKKNADGWLKVPEWYEKNAKQSAKADRFPHDYGIVAASRETTMSAPFTTLSKVLKAAPNATEKKKNSFLLGFPGRIYANGAWVRAKKCKYWVEAPGSVEGFNDALVKHYIDSSAGQSGCVLYTLDEAGKKASALGIHVGGNDAEKYNVAVKLCSGSSAMAELKGWASNPPHGDEEEFDLDDDGGKSFIAFTLYGETCLRLQPHYVQNQVRVCVQLLDNAKSHPHCHFQTQGILAFCLHFWVPEKSPCENVCTTCTCSSSLKKSRERLDIHVQGLGHLLLSDGPLQAVIWPCFVFMVRCPKLHELLNSRLSAKYNVVARHLELTTAGNGTVRKLY